MIRNAMLRQGITQVQLEAKSGVTQATISRTLRGTTTPDTATINKLFVALGLSNAEPVAPKEPINDPLIDVLCSEVSKMNAIERAELLVYIYSKRAKPPSDPPKDIRSA